MRPKLEQVIPLGRAAHSVPLVVRHAGYVIEDGACPHPHNGGPLRRSAPYLRRDRWDFRPLNSPEAGLPIDFKEFVLRAACTGAAEAEEPD